jgi:hypothetical protein
MKTRVALFWSTFWRNPKKQGNLTFFAEFCLKMINCWTKDGGRLKLKRLMFFWI